MRLIILTHGGADLVLEKLGGLENIEIAGVFIENDTTPRRSIAEKLQRSIKYDGILETMRKFFRRPNDTNRQPADDRTEKIAATRGLPIHKVPNFHSAASIDLMRAAEADLGVIYGTNIIKESVFFIPRLGSINLHQGLAPLYRGGPPVFWELYNGEESVGITAHFVAAKVDTGDIILQKNVPLKYDPAYGTDYEAFIADLRDAMRGPSAEMIAEAVRLIAAGDAPRTPQDTSVGKRYRLPVKKEKDELRRRIGQRIAQGKNAEG